jgi:hypothetical protein
MEAGKTKMSHAPRWVARKVCQRFIPNRSSRLGGAYIVSPSRRCAGSTRLALDGLA